MKKLLVFILLKIALFNCYAQKADSLHRVIKGPHLPHKFDSEAALRIIGPFPAFYDSLYKPPSDTDMPMDTVNPGPLIHCYKVQGNVNTFVHADKDYSDCWGFQLNSDSTFVFYGWSVFNQLMTVGRFSLTQNIITFTADSAKTYNTIAHKKLYGKYFVSAPDPLPMHGWHVIYSTDSIMVQRNNRSRHWKTK